jgi:hypothetical protein
MDSFVGECGAEMLLYAGQQKVKSFLGTLFHVNFLLEKYFYFVFLVADLCVQKM